MKAVGPALEAGDWTNDREIGIEESFDPGPLLRYPKPQRRSAWVRRARISTRR
jgi:hypothetical protein